MIIHVNLSKWLTMYSGVAFFSGSNFGIFLKSTGTDARQPSHRSENGTVMVLPVELPCDQSSEIFPGPGCVVPAMYSKPSILFALLRSATIFSTNARA